MRASLEKVEKVVKPPQRPTVRNNDHVLLAFEVLLKKPQSSPMRRHPPRFTMSVPHGNPLPTFFMTSDVIYLADPPRKLPAPTAKMFFRISVIIDSAFVSVKLDYSALNYKNVSVFCISLYVLMLGPSAGILVMSMIKGYKEGMAFFQKGEYALAVECFENGTAFGGSADCLLMLGKCYEDGLGVELDWGLAKDYYKVALVHFKAWRSLDYEEITWLKQRLENLRDVQDTNEVRKYVNEVGWVTVKRGRVKEWTIKFSENGTLVTIGPSIPFCRGFMVAEAHSKRENPWWTCDGKTRFYDGYSLRADFFSLDVRRGELPSFESHINGAECMVIFPHDADLSLLYVQETIMNLVRDLLRKRAEVVFPRKLREVSERIGVPFGKCSINMRLSRALAQYIPISRDVEFSLDAIQLPKENFESLCIHELAHSFSSDHNGLFWSRFRELAGQRLYDLDSTHHCHGRWNTLKLIGEK